VRGSERLKNCFFASLRIAGTFFIVYFVAVILFLLIGLLLDKDGSLWNAMMGI